MTIDDTNRRVWLDYITELNNRYLNNQRASGITTWAIGGLIGFLILNIFEYIPSVLIANQNTFILQIIITTAILNLTTFTFAFFVFLLSLSDLQSETRIKSKIDRGSKPALYVPLLVFFLIIIFLNLYSEAKASVWGLSSFPFKSISLFFIISIIGNQLTKVVRYLKNRRFYKELPNLYLSPFFHPNPTMRNGLKVFSTILFISLLILALIPFIEGFQTIFDADHLDIVKVAIYITILIYMLLFVCFRVVDKIGHNFLLNLERRIVLENLQSDQIKKEFIINYFGETLRDWIINAERNLNNLYKDYLDVAIEAEERLKELEKMDSTLRYEIHGRRKDIFNDYTKAGSNYHKYSQKLLSQITHLMKENAFYQESDVLRDLIENWEEQSTNVKSRSKKFFDFYAEFTKNHFASNVEDGK